MYEISKTFYCFDFYTILYLINLFSLYIVHQTYHSGIRVEVNKREVKNSCFLVELYHDGFELLLGEPSPIYPMVSIKL